MFRAAAAQAFTNGVLTSEVVKSAPGGAEISNTKAFNPAGVLTSETQVHAEQEQGCIPVEPDGCSYAPSTTATMQLVR